MPSSRPLSSPDHRVKEFEFYASCGLAADLLEAREEVEVLPGRGVLEVDLFVVRIRYLPKRLHERRQPVDFRDWDHLALKPT